MRLRARTHTRGTAGRGEGGGLRITRRGRGRFRAGRNLGIAPGSRSESVICTTTTLVLPRPPKVRPQARPISTPGRGAGLGRPWLEDARVTKCRDARPSSRSGFRAGLPSSGPPFEDRAAFGNAPTLEERFFLSQVLFLFFYLKFYFRFFLRALVRRPAPPPAVASGSGFPVSRKEGRRNRLTKNLSVRKGLHYKSGI